MLTIDRRKCILDKLYHDGSVKVNELAALYGVGGETIRRDLKALARIGTFPWSTAAPTSKTR